MAQNQEAKHQILADLNMSKDIQCLRIQVQGMREGLRALEMDLDYNAYTILEKIQRTDENEILHLGNYNAKFIKHQESYKSNANEESLFVNCTLNPCLFDNCDRIVDSRLSLLHYLSYHSKDDSNFHHCQKITKDEHTVLSFETQRVELGEIVVIGVLNYSNKHMAYDKSNNGIPIVVLTSKTGTSKKNLKSMKKFFIFWLATENHEVNLKACLTLCGRDTAKQAKTVIPVQRLQASKIAKGTVFVNCNYWRVSYKEVHKISNNFRDELHLDISLNECST